MKMQKGFTLIELMIVVAIIGILAAIAIPAYSTYQAKAKLSAGLAEISAGKTAFETFINGGGTPAAPADAGLQASTSNCTIGVSASTITCTMLNAPTQVAAAVITWTRTPSTGVWSCATSGATDKTLAPKSCPQP